jgi:hypothetical protein
VKEYRLTSSKGKRHTAQSSEKTRYKLQLSCPRGVTWTALILPATLFNKMNKILPTMYVPKSPDVQRFY